MTEGHLADTSCGGGRKGDRAIDVVGRIHDQSGGLPCLAVTRGVQNGVDAVGIGQNEAPRVSASLQADPMRLRRAGTDNCPPNRRYSTGLLPTMRSLETLAASALESDRTPNPRRWRKAARPVPPGHHVLEPRSPHTNPRESETRQPIQKETQPLKMGTSETPRENRCS